MEWIHSAFLLSRLWTPLSVLALPFWILHREVEPHPYFKISVSFPLSQCYNPQFFLSPSLTISRYHWIFPGCNVGQFAELGVLVIVNFLFSDVFTKPQSPLWSNSLNIQAVRKWQFNCVCLKSHTQNPFSVTANSQFRERKQKGMWCFLY